MQCRERKSLHHRKKPRNYARDWKNYRICKQVYQSLFVDVAETFIQYINTLDLDKIKQLGNDLEANSWEVKSVVEIEDSVALFWIFQMFYYYNGRLSLTNGFLAVPDEKTPPGSEKISLKSLYKMFNDTKSHRLPSLQFLSALNIFFGADVKLSKDAIAELYKNLLLETLSGRQKIEFEKISDLTLHINFKMKDSVLSNLERKSEKRQI